MKCSNCVNEAKKNRMFCSKRCRYIHFTGDNNPAKRKDVRLKLCESAERRERDPDYSKKLWQRQKYGWINGICLNCKKPFDMRRCALRKFCSDRCSHLYFVGEHHPLWTGISVTYGENWKKQRCLTRERDKNICRICLKSKEQNDNLNMDVHHIIPFKLFKNYKEANRIENLISLCLSCHRKQLTKLSYFKDNVIVRTVLGNTEINRNVLSLLKK